MGRGAVTGRPVLRVIGRSELVIAPIRARALADLPFDVEFELIDSIEGLQRVVTRPGSFDIYHQWHTVDLIWTARCIQAIDLSRLRHGAEITAAARARSGPSRIIDTVFDKLFVQADGTLDRNPTGQLSMLPLLHGVDSFAYSPAILPDLRAEEGETWGWMLDKRWEGRVATIADPVLGMIEAALAVEATRGESFANIGNLTIEEVDEIADILLHKKKIGHFRGTWNSFEEATRLMSRGGVTIQTMFSPGAARLRTLGVPLVISTPSEGCRGWHADLCISAEAEGETLDMAYAYLNWWQDGWAGACVARQGYYATFPGRIRAHLGPGEWEYWYQGLPAERVLDDPYGQPCIPEGHRREGGSHQERMSRARVWNTFMDEHTHVVRRWREFLAA
jgi:putative spermidine/putrescine transport system substrate-binding protein